MIAGGEGPHAGRAAPRTLACGAAYVVRRLQEEEKNKIQNDLRILTERLSRINESLARKVRAGSRPLRIALSCSANGRGAEPRECRDGADRVKE